MAVGGEADGQVGLRPGQPDIGQAALLLQPLDPGLVHGALRGEQTVLPARQEDGRVLQPLGAVQGHDRDLGPGLVGRVIHDQADMLQEALEVLEFLQRLDQFAQVLQPARRVGRLVGLPHGGVAALVEDAPGDLHMIGVGSPQFGVPAVEPGDQFAQRSGGPLRQALAGLHRDAGGLQQVDAVVPGDGVDRLLRLVAEAAFGGVDDALEGQPVVGRDGDAEIGHGVADLQALVEARAAEHPVGQRDAQEPVLEGAHLERGADQDRDAVEAERLVAPGAALIGLDLLADPARLLVAVPVADQADLLALGRIGPQGLAEPVAVGGDDPGGGGEDVRGRAVVLL